jgi:PAS domain S-box-containing protein
MNTTRAEPAKTINLLFKALYSIHLWLAVVLVTLLVIIYYREVFVNVPILNWVGSILGFGLTRHTLERILFLIPVAYGAATLGIGGGLSILALVTTAMLPRVFIISSEPREALFEIAGIIFTGLLIVFLFHLLQKEKQRLNDLETAHKMLNQQIKRLSLLNAFSAAVSQSLVLRDVLNTIVGSVRQITEMEAVWLYLWDEETGELKLVISGGIPEDVLPMTLKLGESLDGLVAQSRQPMLEHAPADSTELSTASLRPQGLGSLLIVPLLSQDMLLGTLGVGTPLVHIFSPDEIDLLSATGNQISMTLENTRLYLKERIAAEGLRVSDKNYQKLAIDYAQLYNRERLAADALRVSERNYRELFENASDAIWIHDLSGKIISVNKAFEKLTGYDRDTLLGTDVSIIMPSHGLTQVDIGVHEEALRGKNPEPYSQELVKKDKDVAIIQLGTNLISQDSKPWAFQHIARDITEEKRIQENFRFYVRQVGQAQEAERKRIARELHDETAQALVAVCRNLDDLASSSTKLGIQDIREQVRNILQGVRNFSQRLRPSVLDDLGLIPAIRWLASDLTKNFNIIADVEVIGEQRQISTETELMIFRVVQEALTNVQKHSAAHKVNIKLEMVEHRIEVIISDNGKGFEIPARIDDLARIGKLGLTGMQERVQLLGGTLTFASIPGKGTTIVIQVPI